MKTCPKCKLTNPEDAIRCDCGYDFQTGSMKESYLPRGEIGGIDESGLYVAKLHARAWLGGAISLAAIIIFARLNGAGPGLQLLLGGLFIGSCCAYMRKKGYEWTYGFLGIFFLVGLGYLMFKPYRVIKCRDTSPDPKSQTKETNLTS